MTFRSHLYALSTGREGAAVNTRWLHGHTRQRWRLNPLAVKRRLHDSAMPVVYGMRTERASLIKGLRRAGSREYNQALIRSVARGYFAIYGMHIAGETLTAACASGTEVKRSSTSVSQ